jgi:hypothetical protein
MGRGLAHAAQQELQRFDTYRSNSQEGDQRHQQRKSANQIRFPGLPAVFPDVTAPVVHTACTHVFSFDWAAVLTDLLVEIGLFPAHAAGGVIFRRLEPDAIVSGLHQFDEGFTRSAR